jgi:L-aminopeptidase/D-esterase-like protein
MHAQRIVTISGPDLHRANLLCMQPSHFIGHLASPDVPEPQSAVKVTRTDEVLIPSAAHRVAAAVAHDGAQAVTLVEVPYLDGSICAAADSSERRAWTAVHTAHLHKARRRRVLTRHMYI